VPRLLLSALAAAAAALACAPAAHAGTQRWASATSTDATGACLAVAPCRLDHAIDGAGGSDEVVVTPGTYAVQATLVVDQAIVVRGIAGEPRPRLVGAGPLTFPTLSVDAPATVRHLDVEATGAGADAMTLKSGALVEDVTLTSAAGDGAKVVSDPDGTLLRDSVVVSHQVDAGAAALKLRDGPTGGSIAVRNVTAWAIGGSAAGVRCETTVGSTTLVNTIVRGAASDVEVTGGGEAPGEAGGPGCVAEHSNLRPAASPGLPAGAGNSAAEPLLRDPAAGDFRPLAGSPTIDAGRADALLGSVDLDGRARVLGAAPDAGAFEHPASAPGDPGSTADPEARVPTEDAPATNPAPGAGAPAPGAGAPEPGAVQPPGPDALPAGVTPPVLGRTVVLAPAQGTVLVRRPGGRAFAPLGIADDLPVGTLVDARRGTVRLSTALPAGHQTGAFRGGLFEVRQSRSARGLTDLVLRGGDFASCPRRRARTVARSAAVRRRGKAVRRLWGRDRGGRFRTRGRSSVATVRGTAWLTEDRCDGTLTTVTEGAVAVRDLRRGTTTLVRAGRSRLVALSR